MSCPAASFDLRQHLVDYSIFRERLPGRGVQARQQVGERFVVPAHTATPAFFSSAAKVALLQRVAAWPRPAYDLNAEHGFFDPHESDRRIEARWLMMSEDVSARTAAFAVGYESVPQFTRECCRMIGLPPVRDAEAVK